MGLPDKRDPKIEGMLHISDKEFRQLSDLIYKQFGIHLNDSKRSLLVRRLQNLVKRKEFGSFQSYYKFLVENPTDKGFSELVNRITTNYTFFNREPAHFEYFLKTALPEISRQHIGMNSRDLRVWCAAASTGEEPYMLAILLMEYFGGNYMLWDAGVLATDISQRALEKAAMGRYPGDGLENLPKHLVRKYFKKIDGESYEAIDKLKREVVYRRFNLINEKYPFKRPFDAIFCRNVMIYFDNETKYKVIVNLHKSLVPGGFLFIGHSESIMQYSSLFKYIMPAVYRKV